MVAPRWPSGPIPWLAIVGMAVGISAAFFPASRLYPVIKEAYAVGLTIFRSEFGYQAVMGSAIVAHIVEACVTIRICSKNRVPAGHTLGWLVMTLLIGFPAIASLNGRLKQTK